MQQNLFTYFSKTASDKRNSGTIIGTGKRIRSGDFFLLLEQMTNSYPYPVICLDRSGNIVYCNIASESLNLSDLIPGNAVKDVLHIPDNIGDLIFNDRQVDSSIDISDRRYSALLKGSSELEIAFIYFQDSGQVKKIKEDLELSNLELSNLKLRKFSAKLNELLEEEKQKLACELHDTLGQNLLSVRIKLQKHRDLFDYYNSTAEYQGMLNLLENSFKHIKFISYSLKPRILDEMGLEPALLSFCNSVSDETGIKSSVNVLNCPEQLEPRLEAHLYRIIQETLHNRIFNSDLSEFNIQLIDYPLSVKIFFSDNGTGSVGKELKLKEFGTLCIPLDFIQDKVENMGGEMKIDISPDNGTIIIIEIPKNLS